MQTATPASDNQPTPIGTGFDGVIDAALAIASQRAAIQRTMKRAILDGDPRGALLAACELVNIAPAAFIDELVSNRPQ